MLCEWRYSSPNGGAPRSAAVPVCRPLSLLPLFLVVVVVVVVVLVVVLVLVPVLPSSVVTDIVTMKVRPRPAQRHMTQPHGECIDYVVLHESRGLLMLLKLAPPTSTDCPGAVGRAGEYGALRQKKCKGIKHKNDADILSS
ncbi:hypothetical protein E2C01_046236 [Portunus trituberculatus]|uniref:Uncharacterized protein n=1 Tax=Portunus trituberculatus TaxID=210409 RepID=A0A5B7G5E0_PORTR|nr:hypothetical protein [Portunus trituberculatus]